MSIVNTIQTYIHRQWEIETYIHRQWEIEARRNGFFDAADFYRQWADSIENGLDHQGNLMNCTIPLNGHGPYMSGRRF